MHSNQTPSFFAYWGKARPSKVQSERYHLLPYHCLDVAACGQELFRIPRFSLAALSRDLHWEQTHVEALCLAFLAVHDIGKFARSFQNLAPNLSPSLVGSDVKQNGKEISNYRHDTLGWVAMNELAELFPSVEKGGRSLGFLDQMAMIFAGHHGKPPLQMAGAADPQPIRAKTCFRQEDFAAAKAYMSAVLGLFAPVPLPVIKSAQLAALQRHSWTLGGLAVLADWLGSDNERFRYREEPMDLSKYWSDIAVPTARRVVASAGLSQQRVRAWTGAAACLPHLLDLTPLQQYAAAVPLGSGPQFFLLEDVTGAGKTEAALLLCHRLMAGGYATGFYFALPTMATANQMYQRVGKLYRHMFAAEASPSLVLSHGAREMVDGFRESVLCAMPTPDDRDDLPRPGAQCNTWLADSRKKALLADVGVGTIDQALLGVLPVRHQSLRLLGLASKVLVVDEVHAYDDYTSCLIQAMVCAQAQQGGSVVLLSATVPASLRSDLVQAFQQGIGESDASGSKANVRYPLATHASQDGVLSHACATRPERVRRVRVKTLADEAEAEAMILRWAREGKAVCWVRNTVEDARQAFTRLQEHIGAEHLNLFHSRFAVGDRLRIEEGVVLRFGSDSTPELRCGQVLIATQVVEQSLDLDFDAMVTDLAPVDLVIQRAGRLQRHVRDAQGRRAMQECRPTPDLHVLGPAFTREPPADWYKALFPKAAFVYEHHGNLWLTLHALLEAGAIVTPGEIGEPGSVRSLVEAVYGDAALPVPLGLRAASQKSEGKGRAERSLADYNVLNLRIGYRIDAGDWDAEAKTPTRLGDDQRPIYLAREQDGALVPLLPSRRFAWEHSAVRIDAYRFDCLAPEWQARFGAAIGKLQQNVPLLAAETNALVLPLIAEGSGSLGWCQIKGKVQAVRYHDQLGLML